MYTDFKTQTVEISNDNTDRVSYYTVFTYTKCENKINTMIVCIRLLTLLNLSRQIIAFRGISP